MEASPVLLEPIASLKVVVPDKYTGDIMGDLNKRRGRVLGMNPTDHGYQEIVADIPYMELFGYNTDLRSMTGGSGTYSYEFARYEQAPSDIQEKEIACKSRQSRETRRVKEEMWIYLKITRNIFIILYAILLVINDPQVARAHTIEGIGISHGGYH